MPWFLLLFPSFEQKQNHYFFFLDIWHLSKKKNFLTHNESKSVFESMESISYWSSLFFFFSPHIYFSFSKSLFRLRNVLFKVNIFLVLQFESSRSKINCLRLGLVILIFPSRNLVSSLLMGSLISFIIVCSYFCLALYIPYYIDFFFLGCIHLYCYSVWESLSLECYWFLKYLSNYLCSNSVRWLFVLLNIKSYLQKDLSFFMYFCFVLC